MFYNKEISYIYNMIFEEKLLKKVPLLSLEINKRKDMMRRNKNMKVTNLIKLYQYPFLQRIACILVKKKGCEIPVSVIIGNNVSFPHDSVGTVIHPNTIIGNNVKIYQNVTIGRGDIWEEPSKNFEGFKIENGAIICAGAKVLSSYGLLTIGSNSIIGANAVVTSSVPANVIVAGIPAKVIKSRANVK